MAEEQTLSSEELSACAQRFALAARVMRWKNKKEKDYLSFTEMEFLQMALLGKVDWSVKSQGLEIQDENGNKKRIPRSEYDVKPRKKNSVNRIWTACRNLCTKLKSDELRVYFHRNARNNAKQELGKEYPNLAADFDVKVRKFLGDNPKTVKKIADWDAEAAALKAAKDAASLPVSIARGAER